VIVTQPTPLEAVQLQPPALAVTATVPVPAVAACDREVGEIEYEHDAAPDCVTVNVCPAIVSVPEREEVLELAATE
jgi:hypothetical protein